MYVCMCVCVYVCMCVCVYVCMCACMYVCMHECMNACMYVCNYTHTHIYPNPLMLSVDTLHNTNKELEQSIRRETTHRHLANHSRMDCLPTCTGNCNKGQDRRKRSSSLCVRHRNHEHTCGDFICRELENRARVARTYCRTGNNLVARKANGRVQSLCFNRQSTLSSACQMCVSARPSELG